MIHEIQVAYQNIDIVRIYNDHNTDKETRPDESLVRKFIYYTDEVINRSKFIF